MFKGLTFCIMLTISNFVSCHGCSLLTLQNHVTHGSNLVAVSDRKIVIRIVGLVVHWEYLPDLMVSTNCQSSDCLVHRVCRASNRTFPQLCHEFDPVSDSGGIEMTNWAVFTFVVSLRSNLCRYLTSLLGGVHMVWLSRLKKVANCRQTNVFQTNHLS